ncbi:RrF2 family transcriptional regulator [Microbacterium sp. GCS4]|uniref:RrF2 family transcriptional regulator n=1 Tax=Microbacterium sp. GCS4 TaxID=1692239 RepID=UPI000680C7B9|nr:Rrf2 family transcriptional regulator [Microbacterium sp. GCS4]KNY05444.1 hypothetical protein AKH00_13995 [Microbacterium sp. GCS4]
MQITARVDYAVRALAELASTDGRAASRAELAENQDIPAKFLETILADLKRAGVVRSQRGAHGGYTLAARPEDVSIADVIRAVEGPLTSVRGSAPEDMEYAGSAAQLRDVWVAVRAGIRQVLESTTLQHLIDGRLPDGVQRLLEDSEAWRRR